MSRYRCIWCRKHVRFDDVPVICPECGACSNESTFKLIPQLPPGHKVYWSKRERDLIYWKDGTIEMDDGTEMTASGATGHLLHHAFDIVEVFEGKSLTKELEARGYDMTTLKFSIRKKAK